MVDIEKYRYFWLPKLSYRIDIQIVDITQPATHELVLEGCTPVFVMERSFRIQIF